MRATRLVGGGLLGLLALAGLSLGQELTQHPAVREVEGGAGVDFTACIECHADKTSAPVVHPAMEMGCETCHQAVQEDDETEILPAASGNDLCLICHGDKQPEPTQLFLHAPVRTGPCTACHDPHSTQAEHLLRQAAESRETGENLCLGCHTSIQAQIQKPVQHGAVDLGCATCHTTHKSEPADSPEGVFHLAQAEPELCLNCHDAEDASLQAAHLGQPFAGARCTGCHNPHGSEQAKLVNNFVHSPFAERQCELCHEAPQEGRVVLVEGARCELCLTCHSGMQERLNQAKVTHPAFEGKSGCVACHSPHAATYPYQVRRGPVALCLGCHTDLAEARVQKANLHRPAFEMSCLICHQEHAGERPQRLRAEVNDLCLGCHGKQNAARLRAGGDLRLFGDSVKVNTADLAGIWLLPIGPGATQGHPLPTHPVASSNPSSCISCHNPHAADGSPKLFVTETATVTSLCVTCHK